jgi:hypothetical protein
MFMNDWTKDLTKSAFSYGRMYPTGLLMWFICVKESPIVRDSRAKIVDSILSVGPLKARRSETQRLFQLELHYLEE